MESSNRVVGLRVMGIWGEIGKWICQAKICWTGSYCSESIRNLGSIFWDVDWDLIEVGQLLGINNVFWKKAKGRGIYVGSKKPLT